MAFIRQFDISIIDNLPAECKELYQRLLADVQSGCVFPAVRDRKLDFYFAGGRLFELKKSGFKRDPEYKNYSDNTQGLDSYSKCKQQNKNRFINKGGKSTERQTLDRIASKTFTPTHDKVVVLDIEVRINEDNDRKKCDMVLLNTNTAEIMFVEGKLHGGIKPTVVAQVQHYTQMITAHKEKIETQYAEHIRIVNKLFGKNFPTKVALVLPAKLLVCNCAKKEPRTYIQQLCQHDVMWNSEDELSLDDVWGHFQN